jgi:hypothetical protein
LKSIDNRALHLREFGAVGFIDHAGATGSAPIDEEATIRAALLYKVKTQASPASHLQAAELGFVLVEGRSADPMAAAYLRRRHLRGQRFE